MIYKLRMISAEVKAFLRDYEIDSCATFLDFHKFIQEDLGYEPGQLTSFFMADKNWNKGLELTLLDMQNDAGPAAIPMESVKLEDLLKERKDRLLYVYDIFADRSLFLELLDIHPQKKGIRYPICSASIGDAPLQFETLSGKSDNEVDESIRDLFSDFNSDEFEPENLEGEEK